MAKPGKDQRWNKIKQKEKQHYFLDEQRCSILNNNTSKLNPTAHKEIIGHDEEKLSQGYLDSSIQANQ